MHVSESGKTKHDNKSSNCGNIWQLFIEVVA